MASYITEIVAVNEKFSTVSQRLRSFALKGVIVGSVIVRLLEQAGKKPIEAVVNEVGEYMQKLVETLNKQ